jgi:hypothetical protein
VLSQTAICLAVRVRTAHTALNTCRVHGCAFLHGQAETAAARLQFAVRKIYGRHSLTDYSTFMPMLVVFWSPVSAAVV